MFQLDEEEFASLRLQIATSNAAERAPVRRAGDVCFLVIKLAFGAIIYWTVSYLFSSKRNFIGFQLDLVPVIHDLSCYSVVLETR